MCFEPYNQKSKTAIELQYDPESFIDCSESMVMNTLNMEIYV